MKSFQQREAELQREMEDLNRRRTALHLEIWGELCDHHGLGGGEGWELQDVDGALVLVNPHLMETRATRH